MTDFAYHRASSLEQAWQLMAELPRGTRYVAGATDLMVKLRGGAIDPPPPALISLRSVEELKQIEVGDETITIGAGVVVRDLIEHGPLADALPVLTEAARRLGSAQIRNVATVGGNLCNASPCADTAPPLLVLEAQVRIQGPGGASRTEPLESFFVAPGETRLKPAEIVTAIIVERPRDTARSTFLKKGRVRMDLSQASLALLLCIEGERSCKRARAAAGSVGPRPLRLRKVEAALEGKELTAAVIATAREVASREVEPIDDVRSTAEYRRQIVGVYLQRAAERLLISRRPQGKGGGE